MVYLGHHRNSPEPGGGISNFESTVVNSRYHLEVALPNPASLARQWIAV
jgi:hypothetical protein